MNCRGFKSVSGRLFIYIATVLLVSLLPLSTSAQNITESEAQRLQILFQNILEAQQQDVAKDGREQELTLQGEVSVEPADTYYAITLPQMKITYPDGDHIDFGMIAMNAIPHETPGTFKTTMALPSPILGFDEDGQEIMRITLGTQKAAGLWNESLQNFTKLDALYSDITMDMDQGAAQIKIPQLRIIYDLEQDENTRWSGPITMEATNISGNAQEQNASFALDKFTVKTTFDQFEESALKILQDPESPPVLRIANGGSLDLQLNNLKLSKENGDTPETFSLAQGAIKGHFNGALGENASAGFNISFQDLVSSNTAPELAPLIPKSGAIDLTQHNIPVTQLEEILANTPEGDPKTLGLSLMFKIPAILAQSGSYIETRESFLSNDDYRIDLETVLRADMTAVNNATANGTLKFAGLDKVLSMAQVAGKKTKSIRKLARYLERLKTFARVEAVEAGFIHIFDLEMNAAGQILINSQNAMPLILDQDITPPEQPQEQPLP